MITTGTKWFLGLGVVSVALAAVYGWTTGGNGLGPVTVGYKGGVGDHLGYGILVTAAGISFLNAIVLAAWRDADPVAQAQVAHLDHVPTVRPVGVSYWPPVAAFGVALVLIGLVSEPILFIFGLIVLGIVLVEWAVQTWADHASGDPATNRQIRNRLMNPLEFPLAGVLAIAIVVISFSRVFLAIDELSAVGVAGGIATLILIAGAVLASRPTISPNVVVGLVLVAAVVVIGLGIAGAVAGERDFHPEGTIDEQQGALVAVKDAR
ncbi:MAG TPA: hypothetical protein VGJ86_10965 [Acidimicrobiales bacterium]|jgi:hypothetical protein